MEHAPIPASANEVTPAFLTEQLRACGQLGSGTTVMTAAPSDPEGKALSGVTVRMSLTYDRAEGAGPESLIAKFASPDPRTKGQLESLDAYAREIAYYRDLGPDNPLRIPAVYYAQCDDAPNASRDRAARKLFDRAPARAHVEMAKSSERFLRASDRRYCLLIEDLGDLGHVHGMIDPPSPDQLQPVLDELAAFHVHHWGDAHLLEHAATRPVGTEVPKMYCNAYRGLSLSVCLEHFGSAIGPKERTILEGLPDTYEADLQLANLPVTLIHGDPRSDNVLYFDDGPVLIDWALTGYAHPLYDVSYLLGTSLRTDDVGEADSLIAHYLTALSDRGRVIAADRVEPILQGCWRTQLLQQGLSFINTGTFYDDGRRTEDLWVPRLLALLAR